MADDLRVQPGPATTRGAPLTFRFNGRTVVAHEGETVGAALHADGEQVLMRSIKYHRPRGLFCNTGACANCLVRVDGVPNVRACTTPARDGMAVETQNAFPSARRDFFAVVDKVFREKFDYHARFIHPKSFTPLYHAVIRRMAGFGKLPDLRPVPARRPPLGRLDCDVLVVGAGPAGLSAAVAAAEGAADVVLVDEGDRVGGSLLLSGADGVRRAEELKQRLLDAGGRILTSTVATGCYRTDGVGEELPAPGLVALLTRERLVQARPRALVVATGFHETPPRFGGNDLPGVMGARAALLLLHRHGVLPGRRVLLTGDTPLARRAAADLRAAGAEVIGLVGADAWKGARVVEAHGSTSVDGVTLEIDGQRIRERVDCILSAGDETPRAELLQQSGVRLAWNGSAFTAPRDGAGIPGVYAVGDVLGVDEPLAHLQSGARVGEAAARHARGATA